MFGFGGGPLGQLIRMAKYEQDMRPTEEEAKTKESFGIQDAGTFEEPLEGLEEVWPFIRGVRGAEDYKASCAKGQGFYLYTGRGPSSLSLHLGHLVPLLMTKKLAKDMTAPLVVQLTDDEKLVTSKVESLEAMEACTSANYELMDKIFGDLVSQWFVSSKRLGEIYPQLLKLSQAFTCSTLKGCFGIEGHANPLRYFFPLSQIALAFPEVMETLDSSFKERRALIIASKDQDPFFRLARDVAHRLGWTPPTILYLDTLPSVHGGLDSKMSASEPEGCIFVNDSAKTIKQKLAKAYSTGGATMESHRSPPPGGWPTSDLTCLVAKLFGPPALQTTVQEFSQGKIGSGDLKKQVVSFLSPFLSSLFE